MKPRWLQYSVSFSSGVSYSLFSLQIARRAAPVISIALRSRPWKESEWSVRRPLSPNACMRLLQVQGSRVLAVLQGAVVREPGWAPAAAGRKFKAL